MSVGKGNEQTKQGKAHEYNLRSSKAELPPMVPASKTQDVATKFEKTGLGKVFLSSVISRAQDSLHLQSPRFGRAARIGQSSLLVFQTNQKNSNHQRRNLQWIPLPSAQIANKYRVTLQ